ncbi:MAG: hypothetical protein HXY50_16810 [Ignavibacteriaceae bacterium]|nr:hypothetical protein [Ignavibacteriaceae bacterium]
MPNTLAHVGLNSILTKAVIRKSDILLIYIGSIIPDIPWIFQRVVSMLYPNINLYDLRLYFIITSTLFFSLILCLALSLLLINSRKSFFILSMGTFSHLLLDAMEIKWGNGVHFIAPLDWQLSNFNLFFHETLFVYLLTIGGIIYLVLSWREIGTSNNKLFTFSQKRIALTIFCLAAYFIIPLGLLDYPQSADNHFIRTLRNKTLRAGKYFEIDRGNFVNKGDEDIFITPFKEVLTINNLNLNESSIMSIRAWFVTESEIKIQEYHIYKNRDLFSYAGLAILIILLAIRIRSVHKLKSADAKSIS